MGTIKISQLKSTEELDAESLLLVVKQEASRKMKFGRLSAQCSKLIGADIDGVKADITALTGKCQYLSSQVDSVNGQLTDFEQDINNRKATDDTYGLVKLSTGLDDESHGNYGLKIGPDGNAYVHVPSSGGGGSVSQATDDKLGTIKTYSSIKEGLDGCYGVVLSDDGQAYVHIKDVGTPGNYDDISSMVCVMYDTLGQDCVNYKNVSSQVCANAESISSINASLTGELSLATTQQYDFVLYNNNVYVGKIKNTTCLDTTDQYVAQEISVDTEQNVCKYKNVNGEWNEVREYDIISYDLQRYICVQDDNIKNLVVKKPVTATWKSDDGTQYKYIKDNDAVSRKIDDLSSDVNIISLDLSGNWVALYQMSADISSLPTDTKFSELSNKVNTLSGKLQLSVYALTAQITADPGNNTVEDSLGAVTGVPVRVKKISCSNTTDDLVLNKASIAIYDEYLYFELSNCGEDAIETGITAYLYTFVG